MRSSWTDEAQPGSFQNQKCSENFLVSPHQNLCCGSRKSSLEVEEFDHRVLLLHRFVASFSYYGSVLGSSELLEKNLLCVTDTGGEHRAEHHLVDGRCHCVPFASSDYETLLISSLGEVARKSPAGLRLRLRLLRFLAVWSAAAGVCR